MSDLSLTKGDVREIYLGLGHFAKRGPRTMRAILACAQWSSHLRPTMAAIDDGVLRVQEALPMVKDEDGRAGFAEPIRAQLVMQEFFAEPVTIADLRDRNGSPLRFTVRDLPSVDGDDEKADKKREELAGIIAMLGPLFTYED